MSRLLPPILCLIAAGCLLVFMLETWHWPLVGDAVSVHYLILLMAHGMAPYRQIVDAQMPGTYLVDWLVVHVFGGGRAALRLFDFSLIAAAMVAMIAIAWPVATRRAQGWFDDGRYAAFLAGCLFGSVHGRDGIEQGGQRDLIMAVLLLAAYALAFHALRRQRPVLLGLAAFCSTLALTIKPTVLLAAYLVLVLALIQLRRLKIPVFTYVLAACVGVALPLAAVVIFLAVNHSIPAFLDAVRGMWPYYATLQRRPVAYLLQHSFSPLASLLVLWAAIGLLNGISLSRLRKSPGRSDELVAIRANSAVLDVRWEGAALYGGLILCLVSFIVQGKGFVYHRYPFLAFLLLIVMLQFQRAFDSRAFEDGGPTLTVTAVTRYVGALGMIVAALFIAPISTYKISRFDWRNDDYYSQLSADLNRLGGKGLSGHVQCVDAFSGCISTLYRMDLVQSTGFLVDFYFFAPRPNAVIDAMRQHFWQDMQQNPPRVFVVSKQVFPTVFSSTGEPLDTYDKLKRWPQFDDYLTQHYAMAEEHEFLRPVLWASHGSHPAGYRIYVRKP
jgi:hypothetical protein